jgi:hypothetical protein
MNYKGAPVFISSVSEIGSYLAANGLTGEMLSMEETGQLRHSIENHLSRISGKYVSDVRTRLDRDGSGRRVYSHFMWDVIPEKYSDGIPETIVASGNERLCLIFEDPSLQAISLDQKSLSVKKLTAADVYIVPCASGAWLFVLTHEPIGPFLVR